MAFGAIAKGTPRYLLRMILQEKKQFPLVPACCRIYQDPQLLQIPMDASGKLYLPTKWAFGESPRIMALPLRALAVLPFIAGALLVGAGAGTGAGSGALRAAAAAAALCRLKAPASYGVPSQACKG